MAAHTSVFDDMDDLTAQMCITLQLEDITSAQDQKRPSTSPPSDEEVALQVLEADLKAYRVLRGYEEPAAGPEENLKSGDKPHEEEPQPPTEIMLFDCAACGDRFNGEECIPVPCDHYYCDACLEDLFTHAMRDRTLYPPRCCRQAIPWEIVRDTVSDRLVVQFEAKKEELDDKSPMYCHEQKCSQYIKADAEHPNKATCSACQAATCTLCKQGDHEGACPDDEEVQKMREYAKEEGNQECGQCHQLVELSTGCNHITCLCKHEFCYSCGIKWKDCNCDVWDEERLFAQADHVAQRPGMGGAAAAPAIADMLRNNHRDCDENGHGYMEKIEGDILCDGCGQRQEMFIFRCYHCQIELCYRCKNNRA